MQILERTIIEFYNKSIKNNILKYLHKEKHELSRVFRCWQCEFGFSNHTSFINRINTCIKENSRTLVVKHHICKYAGRFPIWVIIEYFSMGMISYFYSDMPNNDKAFIAQKLYGVNYQVMESWLRCLTDLRNKCAHHSRLYYWIFPALPRMPQSERYVPTRRLFAQLYMLKLMYPDHTKWNHIMCKTLIKLVKKYKSNISMKHLDFPYRWEVHANVQNR